MEISLIITRMFAILCSVPLRRCDMSKQKNIPNQTFDNFIVSRSNEKAYSACLDLVNNPQGKFVVIYGANSLGKTHLLYAVNNALIRKKRT